MSPPDPQTLKFLVVDDESFVRTLTVRILGTLGYKNVDMAENGARALEQLAATPDYFDIVICDLNMPEMDGVEFMRHAAAQNFSGGFIVLSGEDTRLLEAARDLAKAHNLNILGAIAKPLKPDALRELLNKLMTPLKPKPFEKQASITEAELRAGIGGPELFVVFQPKVNTTTLAVDGVETLVRWRHADRGVLGPGAFLPLAEMLGLMDEVTDSVYRKAMRQAGEWVAAGINLSVSVNFPVNTFTRPGFADFLVDTARTEGVDPALVVLEVTESQVMQNALDCLEVLVRLRMKKFGLSIDDFGTGQSSLEQLKRIPFNELKIDRAFVYNAATEESARAIQESSADLARKLKLKIVAEGAESRSDWDVVTKNRCDYVQGYYCAKPMSAEELLTFITGWKGPH
jgi:EAL domain-containing protein (putative c-di-GMP-specific phosphodiesterase class I)/FixJ family two-component response regulator